MTLSPDEFLNALKEAKAIAILRTPTPGKAGPAMEAAVRGGFRLIEFTLNTPGALELIEEFSVKPNLLVGAGTVLTEDEAEEAIARGASFLVSPVFDEDGLNHTGLICFDLVHHLHCLNDADNIAELDVLANFDEGGRTRRG